MTAQPGKLQMKSRSPKFP